jgi:hypothetical protein
VSRNQPLEPNCDELPSRRVRPDASTETGGIRGSRIGEPSHGNRSIAMSNCAPHSGRSVRVSIRFRAAISLPVEQEVVVSLSRRRWPRTSARSGSSVLAPVDTAASDQ